MPIGRVLITIGALLGITVLFGIGMGLLGSVIEERSDEQMSAALTVYTHFNQDAIGAEELVVGGRRGKYLGDFGIVGYEFGQLSVGTHTVTYSYEGEFHQVQIEIRRKGGYVTLVTGLPHAGPDDRVAIIDMQGPQVELRRQADQQIQAEYKSF